MRIVLCVAKTDKAYYFQQPVEALYAATILRQSGHDARVLDLRLAPDHIPPGFDRADLAFVVTATYDKSQCFSLGLSGPARAVAALRAAVPEMPVIAVGVHGSIEPEATREALAVDLVLPGELESAIPWFVGEYGRDPAILKADLTGRVPLQADPASLPVPDYDLIDPQHYAGETVDTTGSLKPGVTGLIFANRGCPYGCSYCFVWFGQKLRYRPVALVVEELRQQVARGVRAFFFLDYTFTLDHRWVRELCAAIRDARLDITWTCQTRCERVDAAILSEMRSAGCTGIWYGVEAPWVAEADVAKATTRSAIERAIALTNAAGIRCLLFILVGLERGDMALRDALVDWLRAVPATFSVNPLLPRPHTTLWRRHGGSAEAPSWKELARDSVQIGRDHYWDAGVDGLLRTLEGFPNYILNASESSFVVR
jgi:anaerobic magnesium-protoporphyrin IX monomethyl ester cyclase